MGRFMWLVALVGLTSIAQAEDRCHERPADSKMSAAFKPTTSLRDLAVWVSSFTCKNVVYSAAVERAASTVPITAATEMTPKQALALVVSSLQALGLEVAVKPDSIVIKIGKAAPGTCADIATSTATDDSIITLDDTHHTISRAQFEDLLGHPAELSRSVRIVPVKGRYKLYALRPASVLARLGFANGDTILAINGVELTDASSTDDASKLLLGAKTLEVKITRRGKPALLTVTVK